MYIPKLFQVQDAEQVLDFLKHNSFPAIVSHDGERLLATHLPVEVVGDASGKLTIFSHMSRANPQWRTFGDREALLIFQGAHTYISARWYNHVNVPTWNYTIVHVYGTVRELADSDLYALLSRLVKQHEPKPDYRLETLPQDFVAKEMRGVFGFAVDVTRLEAGYKLSQNRNDEDFGSIVRELDQRPDEASQAVANAMRAQRRT
jgi:transcriptional regulator